MRALLAVAVAGAFSASASAGASFEIAVVAPASSPAMQGIQMGVDESNLQGEFLGVKLSLRHVDADALPQAAVAVIADSPGRIPSLASKARGKAVFNVSDGSDGVRDACLANALHVAPSDRMKADAIRQWIERSPGATVTAAAWHGEAVKFAARDLNNRFERRFGAPMDDLAWAGWFAARAIGDTLMRNPGADPSTLLRLLHEADGLDGQKGDPHSFRASGQLRQPLVIVGPAGELLGEAPVRGAAGGLDSLGASPCE